MFLTTGKTRGFVIEGSEGELFFMSQFPGASYRTKEGVVRMPATRASWKLLRGVQFTGICNRAREQLEALRRDYRSHRATIRKAARRFKLTGETGIPVPLKTLPFSHQVQAFGFASSIPHSALFMDQGTGKTMVAIAVVGRRWEMQEVSKVLVICPKAVKPVWPKELAKHAGYEWSASQDKPPEGPGVQYWITNYDRVKRELKKLKKWKPDMIILDESHRIKNRKAARTSAVISLSKSAKYRMIMSGTPIGKCISEVWSQYKFMDPDIFGSNFSTFKERYLKMGGYMNYQVVGQINEEEFASKLHDSAFRVTKDECLDLPPITYQRLYTEPDAATKKVYREIDKELFTILGDNEVTVALEATKQMKLRQVVGGLVKTDSQEIAPISKLKLGVLRELLEDRLDQNTVIFFSFTHEIKMAQELCNQLGLKHLTLNGATPESEREVFETKFQEAKSPTVALIQIQTGAEGLTLTSSDMVVFYSPTFSFIGYSQARDRVRRIGQTRPVTVVFLILEGTVDERVVDVLELDSQLADTYLETKRNYSTGDTEMAKAAESTSYAAKDLAAEFDITPADLRKHLRALKIEKPEGGWKWAKKTDKGLTEIRKALKARLKELASAPAKEKPAAKKAAKSGAAKKPAAKKAKKAAEAEGEEKPVAKKAAKKKAPAKKKASPKASSETESTGE